MRKHLTHIDMGKMKTDIMLIVCLVLFALIIVAGVADGIVYLVEKVSGG